MLLRSDQTLGGVSSFVYDINSWMSFQITFFARGMSRSSRRMQRFSFLCQFFVYFCIFLGESQSSSNFIYFNFLQLSKFPPTHTQHPKDSSIPLYLSSHHIPRIFRPIKSCILPKARFGFGSSHLHGERVTDVVSCSRTPGSLVSNHIHP